MHLNKISLSPLDTKGWIADNGIHTLAYGHHRLGCGACPTVPSGGN